MLVCMRTTLNLSDAVMAEAKARAAASGRTVTSLVEEALRDLLARSQVAPAAFELPVFGTPDGEVLVHLADNEAVREAMDRPACRDRARTRRRARHG